MQQQAAGGADLQMRGKEEEPVLGTWDCGSPLYDSFELASLHHVLESHLMVLPFSEAAPSRSRRMEHRGGSGIALPDVNNRGAARRTRKVRRRRTGWRGSKAAAAIFRRKRLNRSSRLPPTPAIHGFLRRRRAAAADGEGWPDGCAQDDERIPSAGVTIFPASLCPPLLTGGGGGGQSSSWVLLDLKAYIADRPNAANAKAFTRAHALRRPPTARLPPLRPRCPYLNAADLGTEPGIIATCGGLVFFSSPSSASSRQCKTSSSTRRPSPG